MAIDSIPDEALVAAARQGDSEAFNALLARHRGRAFAWARAITGDPHLAEDVVQEALLNTFLKLGTLVNMSRFLPWLRTVVSNQAKMKMRRGGPFRRERPLTAFESRDADGEQDWGNIDTVLDRLLQSRTSSTRDETAQAAIGASGAETIARLACVLGPREREIFAKHFYKQLSPQEIADHYDTSVNSVHQAVSRIRRKLETERVDIDLRSQISVHLESGGMKRTMLPKPKMLGDTFAPPGISFLHALYHALPYSGQTMTMAEIASFSGYAFLINVRKRDIGVNSLTVWEWSTFITNGLLNVGLRNRYVDYQHFRPAPSSLHKTRKLLFALDLIRSTIDRGMPVMLSNGDFCLAYGYDDERQLLYLMDAHKDIELPYSRLACRTRIGTGTLAEDLYAFGSEGPFHERPLRRLARLTARIVRHAEGLDDTFGPFVNGLSAYDAWIAAIETGQADPLGNAACLATYGWCREQAALFWRGQLEEDAAIRDVDHHTVRQLTELYEEAAIRYGTLAQTYREMQALFPFPDGGDPQNPVMALAAARLLRTAKEAEEHAVDTVRRMKLVLESAVSRLDRDAGIPRLIPIHPLYSFGGARFTIPKPDSCRFRFDSLLLQTGDLRRSIRFYAELFGMAVDPEREEGPVGMLPLEDGTNLLLADLRLDLWHIDWRNLLVVSATDIEQAYEAVERLQWSIICRIDRGAPKVHFFIAADSDGHHWLVSSGPLGFTSVSGTPFPRSPVRACLDRIALPSKDPARAQLAYSQLFHEMAGKCEPLLPGVRLDVTPLYHQHPGDERLQLKADDGHAAYQHVRGLGARIIRGLDDFEDGTRGFIAEDPDGTPITIRLQ
ncbi:MAG: polymerase subunit sigma-24 [Paenibacillaceae bacterium]|nr:polymerase subunit sigma-24 [Paenibacillaceae bacterium]